MGNIFANYAKPGVPLAFYRKLALPKSTTPPASVERLFHGLWAIDADDVNSATVLDTRVKRGDFRELPAEPGIVVVESHILVARDLLEAATAKRFDPSDTFAWRKQIESAMLRRVSLVRYTIGESASYVVESSRFNGLTNIVQHEMSVVTYTSEKAALAAVMGRVNDCGATMGGAVHTTLALADLLDVKAREKSFEPGFVAEKYAAYAIEAAEKREAREREKREQEKKEQRELREREKREAEKQREREERAAAEQAERAREQAERAARGDVSELDDGALRALLRKKREEAKKSKGAGS